MIQFWPAIQTLNFRADFKPFSARTSSPETINYGRIVQNACHTDFLLDLLNIIAITIISQFIYRHVKLISLVQKISRQVSKPISFIFQMASTSHLFMYRLHTLIAYYFKYGFWKKRNHPLIKKLQSFKPKKLTKAPSSQTSKLNILLRNRLLDYVIRRHAEFKWFKRASQFWMPSGPKTGLLIGVLDKQFNSVSSIIISTVTEMRMAPQITTLQSAKRAQSQLWYKKWNQRVVGMSRRMKL